METPALDKLTWFHGRLSDLKVVWWPFLFLKPKQKTTPISWLRLLIMTLCFGAWFTLVFSLRHLFIDNNDQISPQTIATTFGYGFTSFFVWFNVVTRPLWNRRARLLRESGEGG